MRTYNFNILLCLALLVGCFSACSDKEESYDPASPIEGSGAYFPSSVVTSYTLDGTEGSITIETGRANAASASQDALTATVEGGDANVFTIPSTVSYSAGASDASITINYKNLVRGQTYKVTLAFPEGNPYAETSVVLTILYPAEVLEEWVVVSTNAVFMDNLFTAAYKGVEDIKIEGITVEKEKNSNKYRFRSPYNNDYFDDVFDVSSAFPAGFEFPYFVLDGETYKDQVPGKYFIPRSYLGFEWTNAGPKVNESWHITGSVAGNLTSGGSPIPLNSSTYPIGTYDEKTKMFDFGAIYLNFSGEGYFVGTGCKLYLDPALMGVDYDRDFTWDNVEDATGYFTSEIIGESWMQPVQQAEEDETFYRFPSLYAKDVPIYFYYDADKGTIKMPKHQPTGMTTFGNDVFVELVADETSVDQETNTLTFGLSFYLADKDGNKTADLLQVSEVFTWGQGPLDKLEKGKKIDDYVGNWKVPVESNSQAGYISVSITKADATTLLVNGLSVMRDYDDTVELFYDSQTGYLEFGFQQVTPYEETTCYAAVFDSEKFSLSTSPTETFIGGLTKDGVLTFLNNPSNEGVYDAMIFLKYSGGFSLLSGFWNYLEWTPIVPATSSFNALNLNINSVSIPVEAGVASKKRTYNTELNLKGTPVQKQKTSTSLQKSGVDTFLTD